MKRIRWYHATLPVGLRSIASKLEKAALIVDGEMGFRLERVRNDQIDAIYFERQSWTERAVDPFGRESVFERTGYKSLRFNISKTYPELELIEAPRGLGSFFSRIAELTDFEAVVEPLNVDVLAWSLALQRHPGTQFRVSGITVTDLNVEEGITGRMTVASREKDVQAALKQLLIRRTYSVQKLQLTLNGEMSSSALVLAADGSLRSDKEMNPDVIAAIRQCIPASNE